MKIFAYLTITSTVLVGCGEVNFKSEATLEAHGKRSDQAPNELSKSGADQLATNSDDPMEHLEVPPKVIDSKKEIVVVTEKPEVIADEEPKEISIESNETGEPLVLVDSSEKSFSIPTQQLQVDVFWFFESSVQTILDAKIRKNISDFYNTLAKEKDVKMTPVIVSSDPGSTFIIALFRLFGFFQDVITVKGDSKDLLKFAASAFCDANPSEKELRMQCEKMSPPQSYGLFSGKIEGKLLKALRSESRPVFIFSTKSDARNTEDGNAESFRKFLRLKFPDYNPSVYSMISKSTNCIWGNWGTWGKSGGSQFEKLASLTGAKTFDICKPDWESSLKDVAEGIREVKDARFNLGTKVSKILKVEVDGKVVPMDHVLVSGEYVLIKDGFLKPNHQNLRFIYQKH